MFLRTVSFIYSRRSCAISYHRYAIVSSFRHRPRAARRAVAQRESTSIRHTHFCCIHGHSDLNACICMSVCVLRLQSYVKATYTALGSKIPRDPTKLGMLSLSCVFVCCAAFSHSHTRRHSSCNTRIRTRTTLSGDSNHMATIVPLVKEKSYREKISLAS